MRGGTRTEICRNAHARSGRPAQQARRQRVSAGAELEERMWGTARLPKSALGDLLYRGFAKHQPARWERLVERKRSPKDRKSLRFSPALAHGFALRDRTRHRHTTHQLAGTNRKTAQLFSSKWTAPERGTHAGLLRARAKYLSSDGTYHGTICERVCNEQNTRSFQFSSLNPSRQNFHRRLLLCAKQTTARSTARCFSQRARADDAGISACAGARSGSEPGTGRFAEQKPPARHPYLSICTRPTRDLQIDSIRKRQSRAHPANDAPSRFSRPLYSRIRSANLSGAT